jgi:hypothetical protein
MANKSSKSSKSPMAVNKSDTPPWMKTVIIMLVIAFGGLGIVVVAGGTGMLGSPTTSGTGTTSGGTLNDQYKPRVDAAVAALAASPDNPDIIIQVGHAYFDWARAVYESGQPEASIPTWLAAVSYYDQTLALDPENDIALGNKAFALYYAQDNDAAAALQAFITGASDNPDLVQQVENAKTLLAEVQAAASAPATTPATTTP